MATVRAEKMMVRPARSIVVPVAAMTSSRVAPAPGRPSRRARISSRNRLTTSRP